MLRVGVTGGIGSGKSLVCRIFEMLGVPVFYADIQAKKLMDTDPVIQDALVSIFGSEIIKSGQPDRGKLASIIFKDSIALNKINNIIHPAVRKDFDNWAKTKTQYRYVIEEAAILFETGAYRLLDFNLTVSAPEELRIQRIVKRDLVTKEDVLLRMKFQMKEENRIKLADAVIVNDDTQLVIPQVIELHKRLLNLAENKK